LKVSYRYKFEKRRAMATPTIRTVSENRTKAPAMHSQWWTPLEQPMNFHLALKNIKIKQPLIIKKGITREEEEVEVTQSNRSRKDRPSCLRTHSCTK